MTVPVVVADSWTGADGTAWNPAVWPTIRDARAGSQPPPSIQGNAGAMAAGPGDGRMVAFTTPTITNFDLTVRFRRPDVTEVAYAEIGYRVGTGITSGPPDAGYALQIVCEAGGLAVLQKINAYDTVLSVHDTGFDDGVDRWFRIRVKGDRHRIKWWTVGASEPPTWRIDLTDATYTSGRMFLGLYPDDPADATVVWDDYTMTEIVPPDQGINVGAHPVSGIRVGAAPVVACFQGTTPIPIP